VRRRAAVVALALACSLVGAACGGPEQKVSFGGKAVAVNVSFGNPAPDDPRAPKKPFVLGPVLGGVGVVPVEAPRTRRPSGGGPLPPPPPPPECPAADIVKPPVDEATRHLGPAPGAGDLSYRIDGRVDGAEVKGEFTRTVSDVVSDANGVRFKVSSDVLGVTSTHSFVSQPARDRVPGSVGLAAVSAEGRGIDNRPSFTSPKPLILLPLDATVGQQWADAATDPLTATTYTVAGTVIGKSRVWACGENVDAWQVKITQRVVTPFQTVESDITDWIATQYGGLIVQETVSWTGSAGGVEVRGEYTATINEVPGVAGL